MFKKQFLIIINPRKNCNQQNEKLLNEEEEESPGGNQEFQWKTRKRNNHTFHFLVSY